MGGTPSKYQSGGMSSNLPYEINEKILSYLDLAELQSVVNPNSPYDTKRVNFQSMMNNMEYALDELSRVGKETFITIWNSAIPEKSRDKVWTIFWHNLFTFCRDNIHSIWEALKDVEDKIHNKMTDKDGLQLRRDFVKNWNVILPSEYQLMFWQALFNYNNEQKFDAFHPNFIDILRDEHGIDLDEPFMEDRFISEYGA